MPPVKLVTKEQWDKMNPKSQGYCVYMQGSLPGSELADVVCPYRLGSKQAKEYAEGEMAAVLDAQDSEE
jgi:hypothetical protein